MYPSMDVERLGSANGFPEASTVSSGMASKSGDSSSISSREHVKKLTSKAKDLRGHASMPV